MSAVVELTNLIRHHGIAFVAGNVFAEQIGLPIPAIPTLILAGALTMREEFSVTAIVCVAIFASVAADLIWFALGRRKGNRVLRLLCRISLSPDSCVQQTEGFFERWGSASLLFAKFIPGFSTIAPPMAGASGLGVVSFLIFDGLGSALWVGLAVTIGRVFHQAIDRVLQALESLGSWSVAVVLTLLALFILWRWLERRRFFEKLRMARISPGELNELLQSGAAVMIADARSPSARRRDGRSLPGAIAIDPRSVDVTLDSLAPHTQLILYCT